MPTAPPCWAARASGRSIPSQIALANEVFSPSEAEMAKAKRILEAMVQAQKEGRGAVALDGKLIDFASIRQAEVMVKKAEQIAGL